MRHRRPQSRTFRLIFILVAIMASAISLFSQKDQAPVVRQPAVVESSAQEVRAQVARVYDGDTIKLSTGEKVRLIGVDTPELHDNPKLYRDVQKTGMDAATIKQMGQRSYEFTQKLLSGREVRLEFDAQSRDKYGRLLAYVYLDDGTFVNEEILKNGYAYVMTIPPNVKHAEEFKSIFAQARAQKRGLWQK